MRFATLLCACLLAATVGSTEPQTRRASDSPARLEARSPAISQALRERSVYADPGIRVDTNRLRRVAQSLRPVKVKFVVLDTARDEKALTALAARIRIALVNARGLEFRHVSQLDAGPWTTRQEIRGGRKTGYEEIFDVDGRPVSPAKLDAKVFSKKPIVTGADLLPNARAVLSSQARWPVIMFEFNDAAKSTFEMASRALIGKTMGIFLDRKLISAPRINDVIPGKGIIEGDFTLESARALADRLNGDPKLYIIVGGRTAVAASDAALSSDRARRSVEQAASLVRAGDITGALEKLARDLVR